MEHWINTAFNSLTCICIFKLALSNCTFMHTSNGLLICDRKKNGDIASTTFSTEANNNNNNHHKTKPLPAVYFYAGVFSYFRCCCLISCRVVTETRSQLKLSCCSGKRADDLKCSLRASCDWTSWAHSKPTHIPPPPCPLCPYTLKALTSAFITSLLSF